MKLFLFAVAWLASGVCLIAVCRVLSRLIYPKMIGWNAVVAAFPSRSVETVADAYMGRGGTVGSFRFGSSGGYNIFGKRGGTFDISITEQGLAVTADFSPRAPILVRWEDIRAISVGDSSLAIVLNYAKPIQFYLP